MLPWLTIYDHTNHAQWRHIYLAYVIGLKKTVPEVHTKFTAKNFVVKRTKRHFNQVPADQATEWINKTCKMKNGIIGITIQGMVRPETSSVSHGQNNHVFHRISYISST